VSKTNCLLCDAELTPFHDGLQEHPETIDCDVRLTDAWGVAVEETIHCTFPPKPEPMQFDLAFFPFVDDVLLEIFTAAGLPRLGGQSSGRGWSSISTYQRCPYAWQRRYGLQIRPAFLVESPALAIGTLIHTFLAVMYAKMIDEHYPLTPDDVFEQASTKANPAFVEVAWRVFFAYRVYYSAEKIQPLAIEHDLKDPRTGESCRYDLIAYFPESVAGRPAGTHVVEHKSTSRFDSTTLDSWPGDGEVLGQVALWRRLGLDHRFGKLQGVIVNLLGKQKTPQFHRTLVAPESWQIEGHLDDLKRWEGLIQLSRSSNNFPRARGGCINKFGRCDYWDHCNSGDA
jgi:hypothetical protein